MEKNSGKTRGLIRKLIILAFIIITGLVLMAISQFQKPLRQLAIIDKIVIEKSSRRMAVYNSGTLLKTYRIALGKHPEGDKQFDGDERTPEGLYFINDKNSGSGYHKNLEISYPDAKDGEEAERNGHNPGEQIKIHGIKNGLGWIGHFHRFVNWTDGCIAVTNKEIDELYEAVPIGTPIEIKK